MPLNLPLKLILCRTPKALGEPFEKETEESSPEGFRSQQARRSRQGAFGRSEAEAGRSTYARDARGDDTHRCERAAPRRGSGALHTKTKKDTVNTALREVTALAARRRDLRVLASRGLPDLEDDDVMRAAWRQ